MLKAARLARPVALLLALALFAACNSDQQSNVAEVTVEATPRQIDGQGRPSLLSVETRDAKGQPGTGVVTLTASAGTFSDGTTQTTLTLANGLAGIGYTCNANTDRNCAGQIRIDASWGQLKYSLILNVANNQNPDGGTSPDAGDINIGYLALTASKSPIFYNVGDFSNITAQLSADAGTITGQTIGFSANLGGFTLPDGALGPRSARRLAPTGRRSPNSATTDRQASRRSSRPTCLQARSPRCRSRSSTFKRLAGCPPRAAAPHARSWESGARASMSRPR